MVNLKKIKFPTHGDDRGNLTAIELKDYTDWDVKRVYYVTSVKGKRGGHAVIGEKKIYVCMEGKVKGRFHDGNEWHEFELNGPDEAILMEGFCWREFDEFTSGSVLTAISNMNYEPEKYIYDFDKFLEVAADSGQ